MNKINKLIFSEKKFNKIMINKIKALNEVIYKYFFGKN